MLNDITQVVSNQHNVNMRKLVVECDNDIFTCRTLVLVKNTSEVEEMIKNLKAVSGVNTVIRL